VSASTGVAKATEPANSNFMGQARTSGRRPTILIVEDHDDTREMLRTLFKMWGCRVVEACNGLEAVEAASRERPAFVFIDGNLPLLDGLGATRRIRENALLSEVKIVALSGWDAPSYHAAALAAGCNDCLIKPLDLERLHNYLVPLLGGEEQPTT
jgi:CheY-like chemotaxis protein